MRAIRVTFADGNTLETSINGTEAEIRDYYIGREFNFGDRDWGDKDNMQVAVDVEFLNSHEQPSFQTPIGASW